MTKTATAQYLAANLHRDRAEAVRKTAAWLLDTGQARRSGEVVREAQRLLAEEGYLFCEVTTAHPLTAEVTQQLVHWLKQEMAAREVELVEHLDPDVVGGIIVQTPTKRLDASLNGKLRQLVQEKV